MNQVICHPLFYHRSNYAWSTHPKHYYAAEQALTRVGKILFDLELDFGWCHSAIPAKTLVSIIPQLNAKGIEIYAQLLLNLIPNSTKKEVNWLAWEDPYIFDKEIITLKAEVEKDPHQIQKRLEYVKKNDGLNF